MDEIECGLEVHVDDGIPLRLTHPEHQAVLGDTGIVHENIYMAELCHNLVHNFLSLSEISSIGSITFHLMSKRLKFLDRLFSSFIDYEVSKSDISTF